AAMEARQTLSVAIPPTRAPETPREQSSSFAHLSAFEYVSETLELFPCIRFPIEAHALTKLRVRDSRCHVVYLVAQALDPFRSEQVLLSRGHPPYCALEPLPQQGAGT